MSYIITPEAVVETANKNFCTKDAVSLLEAAFDFGLGSVEFKVYFCLTRLANSDGKLSQSIEKLKSLCKIKSRNTVNRVLDSLVAMAIVRRFPNGKSFIYQLTNPLEWVKVAPPVSEPKPVASSVSSTEKIEQDIQEKSDDSFYAQKLMYQFLTAQFLSNSQRQQDSSTPPPKGGCAESAVAEKEMESAQILMVSKFEQKEPAFSDEPMGFAEKIEFFRSRGCQIGTPEQNGRMVVMLDGFALSVEEFMQRSLSSLDRATQYCADGVAMFKAKLAEIAQKHRMRYAKTPGTA